MKKFILVLILNYSATSFAQYSTYNANSHNQYNYNSGYTPPARPAYTAPSYYKSSYTSSYTKPSYNSNTPSYTPSTSTYTSKTYSSGNSDNTKTTPSTETKATDATNTTTPSTNGLLSKQWLTNLLATPLTADEERASLKIAKELIILIESEPTDFKGYKGKLIDSSKGNQNYEINNTDFLHSKEQRIWYIDDIHGIISKFDDAINEYTIRLISLAFLKQIPFLTAGKEEYKMTFRDYESAYSYSLTKINKQRPNANDEISHTLLMTKQGKLIRLELTFDAPFRAPSKSSLPSYIPDIPSTTYTPSTTNTPATNYSPVSEAAKVIPSKSAQLWLTNHVGGSVTAEENKESLKTAKDLLKLIQSATNNFVGYKGKSFKDTASGNLIYDVINTEFLHCNDQKIEEYSSDFYHYFAYYPYNEANKKNIRNIYLAFLKQVPLLSNESSYKLKIEVDEDTKNNLYHLIDESSDIHCSIDVGNEDNNHALVLSFWSGKMK